MKTRNYFKTLLLLVVMVVAGGNSVTAQDTVYHPFADHSVWSVNNIKYGTWGDTIICGRDYLKVYRQEEDHPFDFDVEQAEYFCAIRNDTAAQRVYGIYKAPAVVYKYTSSFFPYFSIVDTVTDSTEFLLYDFNIGIEDTMEIAAFEEHFNDYGAPGIYVYEISLYNGDYSETTTTLSDNSTRKTLKVELLNLPQEAILYEMNLLEWVEGVGNMDGTFTVARTSLGFAWEGTMMWLLCYEQNGSTLLSRSGFDLDLNYDCYYHVGIEETLILEGNIYPNPTNGLLHIDLSGQEESLSKQVSIYSVTGQIIDSYVFNSHNFEINLQDYPSGIYIIKVTDETGIVLQEKIIKR